MAQIKKKGHSHTQVSPTVDAILTGTFFLLIIYACQGFWNSSPNHMDLAFFFGFCGCVYLAIQLTEFFSAVVMRDIVSKKFLNSGSDPDPLAKKANFVKFVSTAWQFVIHVSMCCFEFYILWDEAWLSHPYTTFIPFEYTPKDSLRYFYILQIAIWIMTCVSHRFNSDAHAHKDYVLMYVHHLATIALVAISFNNSQTRIGLVVLFLHDCSDIAIDLLKLTNYLALEGYQSFFLNELTFVWIMISWLYYRVYYFPKYIIYHGTMWAMGLNGQGLSVNGDVPPLLAIDKVLDTALYNEKWWVGIICTGLLILLFIMHVWWFFLLARIMVRVILGEDHRKIANEEYEGDFEEEDLKKAVKKVD